MKFRFMAMAVFVLTLGTLSVGAAPAASPAPAASAPTTDTDAAVTAQAKEWLHRAQTGDIDHAQLDKTMDGLLTPDFAKQVAAQFGPLGDPVDFKFVNKEVIGDNTAYIFRVSFKALTLNEIFSLDTQGKISGLRFAPAQ